MELSLRDAVVLPNSQVLKIHLLGNGVTAVEWSWLGIRLLPKVGLQDSHYVLSVGSVVRTGCRSRGLRLSMGPAPSWEC